MRVTILSHSDTIGGASVVTYRLLEALRDKGIDARMVVYTQTVNSDYITNPSTRNIRGLKFMLERLRIYMGNGFSRKNLFKVSIANIGLPLHKHPWVKEADIIILGWVNQGMLSLKQIEKIGKLGKPIVWTMHDMWNLTGICHHAYECKRYENECGNCPFLGKHAYRHDMSYRTLKHKKKLYDSTNITFVAVSNWLAECAAKSRLLKNRDVRTIPNAFPVDTFYTHPIYEKKYINTDKQIILMGAARLDDPIKGLPYAIDALNYLFDNRPDVANRSMAVFFGDIRDKAMLDKLRFPYMYIGRINDSNILRELYAQAKVVISTSLYETLPGTLIEGQASGCLPVTFDHGGQRDIVTHMQNGYLANYKDYIDFAEGITWALDTPTLDTDLHAGVKRKFSSEAIAERYIELFDELLKRN